MLIDTRSEVLESVKDGPETIDPKLDLIFLFFELTQIHRQGFFKVDLHSLRLLLWITGSWLRIFLSCSIYLLSLHLLNLDLAQESALLRLELIT